MTSQLLQIQHISKKYHDRSVLNDINIDIDYGTIVGLLGNNGAGKTTLLRLISALQIPSTGMIQIQDGIRIGSLIETPAFYPTMSASKNLDYHVHIAKAPYFSSSELLYLVGLPNTHQTVSTFSLGMRKRLGLAIALIEKPDLLILDEPFNGLDPLGIRSLQETITDLNHTFHTTIIISSHDLHHLEKITSDYIFLQNGTVISNFTLTNDTHIDLEPAYFKQITHIS